MAKTPVPESVEAGHYFQGPHGTNFWNKLKFYGLFEQTTEFEDDSLLRNGYGLTDIVKAPHPFRTEPSEQEYREGSRRILKLIKIHGPKVVVFVYKKVLDKIACLEFNQGKAAYGFYEELEGDFNARVFALPLPGVGGCSALAAESAMLELRDCLRNVAPMQAED